MSKQEAFGVCFPVIPEMINSTKHQVCEDGEHGDNKDKSAYNMTKAKSIINKILLINKKNIS